MYNIKALEILKNYLVKRNQTISVAESVTSGHLQAALSLANQATAFFHGGITAYNLGQKARHLSVNPIHALGCNCVSEKVAEEMALNVRKLFSSDWSVGITGYAAPVPELGIKTLFAFYAVAFQNKILKTQKLTCPDKGLYQVQVYYTERVIMDLNKLLKAKVK